MPSIQLANPSTKLNQLLEIKHWRVLVIDDQHDNLTLAGAVFRLHGATVKLMDNAKAALTLLEDFQPTLIITDIAMPEMDGCQFAKAVRANERTKYIPLVALSVRVSVDDQERALQAGFDGYITKPYSVTDIIHYLQDILINLNH